MQSLISAMTTIRDTLVTALCNSLLRGRSLLRAILTFWIAAPPMQEPKAKTVAATGSLEWSTSSSSSTAALRSVDDFLREAEELLLGPLGGDGLSDLAAGLKIQFQDGLRTRMECMLPSYNHLLPTGRESGQYLALDVGGSTLRVALVELQAAVDGREPASEIVRIMNFKIDQKVKSLEGMAFFDWMAERILETISKGLKQDHSPSRPMPMSLAWSFPIEYVPLNIPTLLCPGRLHSRPDKPL
jgi:hexokinase